MNFIIMYMNIEQLPNHSMVLVVGSSQGSQEPAQSWERLHVPEHMTAEGFCCSASVANM